MAESKISSIKDNYNPEIDPEKVKLLGAIKNNYPPLDDREFITEEKAELAAQLFKKTIFDPIISNWKLK